MAVLLSLTDRLELTCAMNWFVQFDSFMFICYLTMQNIERIVKCFTVLQVVIKAIDASKSSQE